MENRAKTEQEMRELNRQFGEFLHTKGIAAKFKVAFANMGESARKQHDADVANFEAVKAQSAEENKEFVEFLRTKGIKAKYRLVVENIKKGAAASRGTAARMAQARDTIDGCSATADCSVQVLQEEFQAFLKAKGIDGTYEISITEE